MDNISTTSKKLLEESKEDHNQTWKPIKIDLMKPKTDLTSQINFQRYIKNPNKMNENT